MVSNGASRPHLLNPSHLCRMIELKAAEVDFPNPLPT
jgi:hypothetical protein